MTKTAPAARTTTERPGMAAPFKVGDDVIYRKQKFSVHPGPHAREVNSAPNGDLYSYRVDKFWKVIALEGADQIVVRTRRGKQLTLNIHDPALRRAYWWERLLFRRRFPALPPAGQALPS
jgi:hypothetical protein